MADLCLLDKIFFIAKKGISTKTDKNSIEYISTVTSQSISRFSFHLFFYHKLDF
jgi:hypothetical protein